MSILLTSLWLGILTSISPCPLTTNIAAVSFVGKRIDKPFYVLLSGLVYSFGRALLYLVLGLSISRSLQMIPYVSDFLQSKIMWLVSPLMIIIGLVLLDLIKIPLPNIKSSSFSAEKIQKFGLWGAFLIGILFAAAFCPVSAALFFSNLLNSKGNWIALTAYGIGTGLPVMIFAFVIAFAVNQIGKFYQATITFEKYARKFTGLLFIGIGSYYLWRIF